ncbi:acetate kinase [Arthrobacter sp. Y-9]|uniref:acetate/propionate family kinase n=1 Tax=Arthrobacter sp. Y-9 TaxID=3039385 RepID=UPI00241C862A|nr:acetate kinase [Arthrobacter sp. Y-9]WFR83818.1 acetate kinase [Arthrobacter sp. Y-9]
MLILVINSGSSSLKYQVRDVDAGEVLLEGLVERIGQPDGDAPAAVPDHGAALEIVAARLHEVLGDRQVDAVGHRVVHGGERFAEPVLINNEVTRAIERLNPLAPLHNPAAVLGIRAITEKWPQLPQVAVFDTAYHRTLPEKAWRYAVPDWLYTRHGIRRYGFHGTSHQYVAARAAALLGEAPDEFNGVILHLGNGASATAVKGGASVDTSMGFTPLEGLVMGTRSGDIDPSILVFLGRQGLDADALDDLLNRESGLLGLGGSNDMRTLVDAAEAVGGDDGTSSGVDPLRARRALEVAAYRLAKYVGAYHVAVGGAQAIVFTAGIGENSSPFRALVCEQLGALGIELDPELNAVRSKEPRVISTPASRIPVLVIPTNEEQAIAEATAEVVAG